MPTSRDAIAMLKEDHKKMKKLLTQLESTSPKSADRRSALLEQIRTDVKTHSSLEEEIFYPAFRAAAQSKKDMERFFEAGEEHHVVDFVLAELAEKEPASDEFAAQVKVLKDLIEHHAEEEEGDMFPRARKLLSRGELVDLGERMATRKKALLGKNIAKAG